MPSLRAGAAKVQYEANRDGEPLAGLFQPCLLVFIERPETTKLQNCHYRFVVNQGMDKQTAEWDGAQIQGELHMSGQLVDYQGGGVDNDLAEHTISRFELVDASSLRVTVRGLANECIAVPQHEQRDKR